MARNRRLRKANSLQLEKVSAPVSLKDQAYLAIKGAILSLKLQPGQALVESELAQQLGISKTPVRTALHQLEREGLVTKVLYKGTYVADITTQDIREIFLLRAVLEGLAARLAAPTFDESDLERARKLLLSIQEALDRGETEVASQYGARFHDLILQTANGQRLQLIVANLDDQVQRFRLLSDSISGRLQKSLKEHELILEALEQRDPELAEQRVKEHLHSVIEGLSTEQPLRAEGAGEEKIE